MCTELDGAAATAATARRGGVSWHIYCTALLCSVRHTAGAGAAVAVAAVANTRTYIIYKANSLESQLKFKLTI